MTDEPRENAEAVNAITANEVDEVDISAPEVVCSSESQPPTDEEESIPQSAEILDKLAQIRDIMENRLSRDKAKEEAFDRLYQELDALKRNKAFEDYRPLFIDLVLLYDRIVTAKVDSEPSERGVLESLQDELTEVLSRREIEPMKDAPGFFDPAFQRAVSTEVVESTELDGKIIRVLREGFVYKEAVLRPQEVVVGRYQPSAASPEADGHLPQQEKETE